MPSHRIVLTNKGFRTISTEFIVDVFSFVLLVGLTTLGLIINPRDLPYFSILLIISILVFMLYRTKNGYLYPFNFFYQILLFWIITPPIFLNYYTIPFIGILLVGYFYSNNPFQRIYFPLGLMLSLVVVSLFFIFGKYNLTYEMLQTGEQLKNLQIDRAEVSGYFFHFTESPLGTFNTNSFSLIEKLSFYTPLLMITFSFRQKNIFLDFFLIIGMALMCLYFFKENIEFLKTRPIALLSVWYLIFSAPGRNRGFSIIYSILTLLITGVIFFALINIGYSFPPILIPILFFLIQSALYILTQNSYKLNLDLSKKSI